MRGSEHGLTIWRNAQTVLLAIKEAVRKFPRYPSTSLAATALAGYDLVPPDPVGLA